MSELRIATRRSPLALHQAESVRERLAALGVASRLVTLETSGDQRLDVPLVAMGGQGVFAGEVQRAVLAGEADVAVHSAKDLPSSAPAGLVLACVTERRDPADALVGRSLAGLGPGATVATGSPRRRALLLERRPDLNVVGLRGNMATRLAAVGRDGVDAVIAAVAALERLGATDLVAERLDPSWFVPQVGQGALALETREGDEAVLERLDRLNDHEAFVALKAERAFLAELGSGCAIPAGALAHASGDAVSIAGVMIGIDGASSVRATREGVDPHAVGVALARHLRDERHGAELPGWEP